MVSYPQCFIIQMIFIQKFANIKQTIQKRIRSLTYRKCRFQLNIQSIQSNVIVSGILNSHSLTISSSNDTSFRCHSEKVTVYNRPTENFRLSFPKNKMLSPTESMYFGWAEICVFVFCVLGAFVLIWYSNVRRKFSPFNYGRDT